MVHKPISENDYAGNPGRRGSEVDYCRVCGGEVFQVLDLGKHPFANNLAVNPDEAIDVYPLSLIVCSKCSCAQLSYCADDTILYSQYTYLTETWS